MLKLLVSRIIIFTITCIWVLGWITFGLMWYGEVADKATLFSPSFNRLLLGWYLVTIIGISTWVAVKGMQFIGRWIKDD